jgi:hypothetical protein
MALRPQQQPQQKMENKPPKVVRGQPIVDRNAKRIQPTAPERK